MAANEVIELDSGSSSDDEFKDPPRKPIGWNYQGTASKNLKDMVIPKVNGTVHKPEKAEENNCSDEIEIVEVSPVDSKPKRNVQSPASISDNKPKGHVQLPASSSDNKPKASSSDNKPKTSSLDNKPKGHVQLPVSSSDNKPKGHVQLPVSSSDNKPKGHVQLPASSSRAEIRKIIRGTTQSNISNFFSKTVTTETDSKTDSKTRTDENVKSVSQNDNTENEKKTKLPTESADTKDTKESEREDDENEKNEDENSETSIAAVESFVSRWEELKSSSDDQKIRDKLWKYYYLAHSSYTHSRKFIGQVERSTRKLSIDNIYVVVKDLLDSLKCYKDRPYRDKLEMEEQKKNGEASTTASPLPEETEEDQKKNQKLRKVEKKMKEISDKIKEFETQEIDLDDDDNSAYLIEDRLKRQFSKLHDYYCKIAECTPATGRPIERKFRYEGSRYEEVNKRISAWVNKTKEFPDYVDILNLLKKVTKESNLPLRPETVRVQAQEIFRDVGRLLKDRRETDDLYSIYSYIDDAEEDPAAKDDELSKKLTENEVVAKDKLDKIFQEYVEKEAIARETADRNVKKPGTEADVNKEGETKSTNQENETKTEGQTEEEDEDLEDYEVYEEDAEADDSFGDDYEEIDDREIMVYPNLEYDDDLGEDTDDELRNVIASASVEEELSEEDVPVIDSEEVRYEEDEGSSSSIVCLDDTSSDSTLTLEKITSEPIKNENFHPACFMDSSCKKRQSDEDFSPQKRPCLGGSNP